MKTKFVRFAIVLALLTLGTFNPPLFTACAQDTAFTYQGRLNDGTNPANGEYDFQFYLRDTGSGGNPVGPTNGIGVVGVTNGLFTVTLDFGNQFPGDDRWLEIGVRTNHAASFVTLAPRQKMTPAPYAIFANTASNLPSSAQLNVTGLTIRNNVSGAPNVIGGASDNYVSGGVVGATIAGGGAVNYFGGIYSNTVTVDFGTVSGGYDNTASGAEATVSGGDGNTASESDATVSGGEDNTASGEDAMVSGGVDNTASGDFSFAAGQEAQAVHDGSFVWADASGGIFSSTAPNQFSVRASGGIRFAGDLQFSGGNAYHNLSMSGGNSTGYLYGSYPALGDGIHLGYNWFYDANGAGRIINNGGGTSRLSMDYGEVVVAVGDVGAAPTATRIDVTTSGVAVYGTFDNHSDRNEKQDFEPVSSSHVLDEVLRLPVSEWSYKVDPKTRHIGPVAQDFYSVFNIGTDDKHIAPIDEGGLAFAAIQGLDQKLEKQRAENAELKQRLETLEKIILHQKSN